MAATLKDAYNSSSIEDGSEFNIFNDYTGKNLKLPDHFIAKREEVKNDIKELDITEHTELLKRHLKDAIFDHVRHKIEGKKCKEKYLKITFYKYYSDYATSYIKFLKDELSKRNEKPDTFSIDYYEYAKKYYGHFSRRPKINKVYNIDGKCSFNNIQIVADGVEKLKREEIKNSHIPQKKIIDDIQKNFLYKGYIFPRDPISQALNRAKKKDDIKLMVQEDILDIIKKYLF